MPDCIWSILSAPLILSKQGLWKVFKKLRSEEGLHVSVELSFPKPIHHPPLFSRYVPGRGHLRTSVAIARTTRRVLLVTKRQIRPLVPHLADIEALGVECVQTETEKEGSIVFALHPWFEGVNRLIKAGPALGSVRQ